jgi:hypothetical protein
MFAGYMANWKVLGRKYTMVIGALLTSTTPSSLYPATLFLKLRADMPQWHSSSPTPKCALKLKM